MAWLNLAKTSKSKSKMLINGKYFKLPSWQLIWPINIWLLPKFLRHSQIRKAVSSTAGLSLIIAGGIIINRISFPTAGIFGAIYCCLNCICMTDMRAAIRRHRSPEVMILMGTTYVWWRMIIVGSLAAALATAPLALTMLAAAANSWLILTKLIIGWSFGISLGWLLGTILVPQPGDVSGQFFAAIASIGGVAALDKTISNDHWLNLIIVAALSATLLAGSWIIEINRNNYYWKGNIHV